MTIDDPCPKCGEEITLVDPAEDVWSLDATDYSDEDAEVWLCVACGWNEEATLEESLDEADANLTWIMDRLAQ